MELPVPEGARATANESDLSTPDFDLGIALTQAEPSRALDLLRPVADGKTPDARIFREEAQRKSVELLFRLGRTKEAFPLVVAMSRDVSHIGFGRSGGYLPYYVDIDDLALPAVEALGRYHVPSWENSARARQSGEFRANLHFVHGRYAYMRGRYDEARRELEAVGPESRFYAFAVGCAAAATKLQARQFSALACRAEEGPILPVPEEPAPPARERADARPAQMSRECTRALDSKEWEAAKGLSTLLPIANGQTPDSMFCRERAQEKVVDLLWAVGRFADSFEQLKRIAGDPGHLGHGNLDNQRDFPDGRAVEQLQRFLVLNDYALPAIKELGRWYLPTADVHHRVGHVAGPEDAQSALRFIEGRYAFITGRYADARTAFDAVGQKSRFHRFAPNCAALSKQFEAAQGTLPLPASPQ